MAAHSVDDSVFALSHLPFSLDDTQNQSTFLSEFHLFGDLPSELRLRIWGFSLRGKVITRTWNNDKFGYSLRRRVPPVLQVCNETRSLFIRNEPPETPSSGKYQLVSLWETNEGGVYINWAIDEVQINRGCMGVHVGPLSVQLAD